MCDVFVCVYIYSLSRYVVYVSALDHSCCQWCCHHCLSSSLPSSSSVSSISPTQQHLQKAADKTRKEKYFTFEILSAVIPDKK